MSVATPSAAELRVLVLAPTSRDATLAREVLGRHRIDTVACDTLMEACAELEGGVGALVIAEEALVGPDCLRRWIAAEPPWSDLPILVLARPGADSATLGATATALGNVTVLERPLRISALVSAVQSALRARQRQYQIRQHLAEREQAEQKLRADDRRKDEFLAILAHELRNPLAPISNGLQLLDLSSCDDARMAAVGEMMERQVGNLTRLVDDLLEVSRVTRGNVELRLACVELAPVIGSAIEASQPLIDGAGHRLDVELPSAPVHIVADPVRLAQVIANVLNNAAKYTDPGGRIRLGVAQDERQVTISVADNGIGIAPEEQPMVFELFMQVGRNRSRAQGGLGIGLTLVKRLVELHEGSVEVVSGGIGMGSEFRIHLPLAASALQAPRRADRQLHADLRGLEILIVDDNRDAADSLAELLQGFGATVRRAYGGLEALAALKQSSASAAILDIGMPDLDGLELARRIRRLPQGTHVKLIALTGWGQAQDIQATTAAGFDHHLVKPVDTRMLLRHLRPPQMTGADRDAAAGSRSAHA